MFSKYSFLAVSVALFNSFLSLLQFLRPPSLLTFFHFLLSPILLIISCVIHGFLALFSTLPTKSLIVPSMHSFILFHCTSAFPLSHSIAQSFSSRVSCTLYISVQNYEPFATLRMPLDFVLVCCRRACILLQK